MRLRARAADDARGHPCRNSTGEWNAHSLPPQSLNRELVYQIAQWFVAESPLPIRVSHFRRHLNGHLREPKSLMDRVGLVRMLSDVANGGDRRPESSSA